MKVSRLKFKEISRLVQNKSLSLDLLGQQFTTQKDRPKNRMDTTRIQQNIIDEYKHNQMKTYHPKTARSKLDTRTPQPLKSYDNVQDLIYFLGFSLKGYMTKISPEQIKSIKQQLEDFITILMEQNSFESLNLKMVKIQDSISGVFQNRLVQLVFYLVHSKIQKLNHAKNMQKYIKYLTLCEYYSFKFEFRQLCLYICMELQQSYKELSKIKPAQQYARKALKLSVVLSDPYHESKMIESLYILNYYQGRLNSRPKEFISYQQRVRIIQSYSQNNQIPQIFKGVDQNNGKVVDKQPLAIEDLHNFVEQQIPKKNMKYFKQNYHQIIKQVSVNKRRKFKETMSRVASVGQIKKFISHDNYITLKPECNIIKRTYQGQVLVTHKKKKQKQKIKDFMNVEIIRYQKMLVEVLRSIDQQLENQHQDIDRE